jgi:hypothetical protein
MPNDASGQLSLLQSIARMLETASKENNGYDSLINVLSLLCIISILNRGQGIQITPQVAPAETSVTAATQPSAILQKALGELNKSEGGPSPDMLTTLLPLLNNPQVKSKLNPANIASILGLVNSLNSGGDKHETTKQDFADKQQPKDNKSEVTTESPAASLTATSQEGAESPRRTGSRSLNWKHSF